jgi:hypothetical protein
LYLDSHPFFLLKQPTEYNTYADIEAAYKCLKEKYGVKDEQLILYGQSVGSGPTLDLASRISELRGVVLHSPILSGLRVLYPVKRTYWFDIYKVEFLTDLCFNMLHSILRDLWCPFYLLFRILIKFVRSNVLFWLSM